ncbi:unnamed protein product [Meloidogyne enterolobii]|uniref:Uncharacterized protein n=1 Tax=Meloidogyne enterolobii TaxID=390850 RepID=A0ACB0YTA5_MELEN
MAIISLFYNVSIDLLSSLLIAVRLVPKTFVSIQLNFDLFHYVMCANGLLTQFFLPVGLLWK